MSAQHIYHTALPLSPETSALRSRFLGSHPTWEEDRTTWQASHLNLSAKWGGVLRTIKAESGSFTHIAVAGQRIATVCEDNTANVYDAVTGVLRLTLKAPQLVTKIVGSPDGSVLFCAHEHAREITMWDTQIGGLIHTFAAKFKISDIAVSLTGIYLASCWSDGTFKVWEVENRCEGSPFPSEPVVSFCWLEPEDQVALASKGAVVILEITTGRTLHTFPVGESVQGVSFSAAKRRLAVWVISGIESRIKVIDISLGLTLVSSHLLMHLSSFTFSSNGDRVFCAMETGQLQFFDVTVSTPSVNYHLIPNCHDYLNLLGTIYSIGLLRNGHLVVNTGGSIQILATEYTHSLGTSLDPKISHVYPLDNGRAICASSRDRGGVYLLDTETMKTLAHYHAGPDALDPSSPLPIVCVSLDQHIVVLCFPESDGFALTLQVIGALPQWESHLSQAVLLGALSPDGKTLIVVTRGGCRGWEIHARSVSDGGVVSYILWGGEAPRNIGFTSGTRFYVEHEVNDNEKEGLALVATSATSGAQFHTKDRIRTTFTLTPAGDSIDIQELSGRWIPPAPSYELDENLEWVVDAKSRRVCWLPPGYVSGIENGHFFVGFSFVMIGQDRLLKRLTFREPCLDS